MKSTWLFTTLWLGSLSAFLTPVPLVAQGDNPQHVRYTVSVSYTHLDVYKRQFWYFSMSLR